MRLRGGMESRDGELCIGPYRACELAQQYGTPLYVYYEDYIRSQCQSICAALGDYPAKSRVYYASKAFPNAAIDKLVHSEGLGIDVSSEGELRAAMLAGIPMQDVIVHGANKQVSYLKLAVEQKAGLIVIDSAQEIGCLGRIAQEAKRDVDILLRVNPGVEAETHKAVRTANLDTKFGIPLLYDAAIRAVQEALATPRLNLRGVHCHVGSQVFKMDVYDVAAGILLAFMQEANALGAKMDIVNLGGGFGCWYSRGDTPMQMLESVQLITRAVQAHCTALKIDLPELMIEPGRAVVAESAMALYTIGAVKEIPGVNTYLVTDGGLFENPRPLFYGSRYTAFLAGKLEAKSEKYYTVSGMSCESDTLIQRVKLPIAHEGDLLAMPSSGAYQLAMSGNYNHMPRPAAVLVSGRRAALIQRRQTLDEVLAAQTLPDDL